MPDKGFFAKLFDTSFESFITTSIIRVLYVLLLIGAALWALALFATFAAQGAAALVLGLIVAPVAFLVAAILARVYLEIVIVLFRIAENTESMAGSSRDIQ